MSSCWARAIENAQKIASMMEKAFLEIKHRIERDRMPSSFLMNEIVF
jgi:hypothetical protein